MTCKNEGRNWGYTSASLGTPKIIHKECEARQDAQDIFPHSHKREATLLILQIRTFGLQNCDTRNFCHLSQLLCGYLVRLIVSRGMANGDL